MIILLHNGTVGEAASKVKIGEEVDVRFYDENGNFVIERGVMVEILEK